MTKLPETIQKDLSKYFNSVLPFRESARVALNRMANDRVHYPSLFNWLFNDEEFINNQIKFVNCIGGSDYEFETPEYTYSTKLGKLIGYNTMTKQFTIGVQASFIRHNLTRDDILDSPFDIRKLIEVPYNGEEENAD